MRFLDWRSVVSHVGTACHRRQQADHRTRVEYGDPRRDFQRECLAVLLLLCLTLVGVWDDLFRRGTLVTMDIPIYFVPMYGFLGRTLRSGHIPFWNPSLFAGTPFVANPESGWMYLPAMLLFAGFSADVATRLLLVFHLVLTALATYALARSLRMPVSGALVAAISYEFSANFNRARCCPVYVELSAWLPLALLGIELAVRQRSWLPRLAAWMLAGFSLSQILAGWIGQGAAYALLVLGGYVAYRTLGSPPAGQLPFPRLPRVPMARLGSLPHRFIALVLHGAAVLTAGFAFAAAGILPRLEFSEFSDLPGGSYRSIAPAVAVVGGWTPAEMATNLLGGQSHYWYAGGATLALAFVAPLLARRRFATPFFAGLTLVAILLTAGGASPTPLHAALYALLPWFAVLHRHMPERVTVVFYLGPAILAGAAVSSLSRWRRRPWALAFFATLPAGGVILLTSVLRSGGWSVPSATIVASLAACLMVGMSGLLRWPRLQRLVPAVLLVVVFADPFLPARAAIDQSLPGGDETGAPIDLATYADPAGAVAFLRQQTAVQPPFRILGYDPRINDPRWPAPYEPLRYADPLAIALIANNRALYFGLQDVQGYDPVQLQRYVEYLAALNGRPRDYHTALVFAGGLGSPLLNLLNVRYLVVPVQTMAGSDMARLLREDPTVYQDDQVRVLENRRALPRAWLVHEAMRVASPLDLQLLATGAADPRQTALLASAPPPLAEPAHPQADRAIVTLDAADRLRITTTSDAPALLMLSEVYYPAWHASVDGKRVPLAVADHALEAVPVPAGTHTVELRYESEAFRLGAGISLVAYLALAVLGVTACVRWRRRRPYRGSTPHAAGGRGQERQPSGAVDAPRPTEPPPRNGGN